MDTYLPGQKKDVTARKGSAATKEASFTRGPVCSKTEDRQRREELTAQALIRSLRGVVASVASEAGSAEGSDEGDSQTETGTGLTVSEDLATAEQQVAAKAT